MNKDYYTIIKEELKARCKNTKYFNRSFFNEFLQAKKHIIENIKNDIDTSYYINNIRLYHEYDNIYKSDFYNKNSGCYCEFLAVFYRYEYILL